MAEAIRTVLLQMCNLIMRVITVSCEGSYPYSHSCLCQWMCKYCYYPWTFSSFVVFHSFNGSKWSHSIGFKIIILLLLQIHHISEGILFLSGNIISYLWSVSSHL